VTTANGDVNVFGIDLQGERSAGVIPELLAIEAADHNRVR
jgi:hypothetical protein